MTTRNSLNYKLKCSDLEILMCCGNMLVQIEAFNLANNTRYKVKNSKG